MGCRCPFGSWQEEKAVTCAQVERPDALVLGLDLFFCLVLAEADWTADV